MSFSDVLRARALEYSPSTHGQRIAFDYVDEHVPGPKPMARCKNHDIWDGIYTPNQLAFVRAAFASPALQTLAISTYDNGLTLLGLVVKTYDLRRSDEIACYLLENRKAIELAYKMGQDMFDHTRYVLMRSISEMDIVTINSLTINHLNQ